MTTPASWHKTFNHPDGWSVTLSHSGGSAQSVSGRKIVAFSLRDLFPGPRFADHVHRTTAGHIWWPGLLGYFFDGQRGISFGARTIYGYRFAIRLREELLEVDQPDEVWPDLLDQESRWIEGRLAQQASDGIEDADEAAALARAAGQIHLDTALDSLKRIENAEVGVRDMHESVRAPEDLLGRSSIVVREYSVRREVQLAIRRLGDDPALTSPYRIYRHPYRWQNSGLGQLPGSAELLLPERPQDISSRAIELIGTALLEVLQELGAPDFFSSIRNETIESRRYLRWLPFERDVVASTRLDRVLEYDLREQSGFVTLRLRFEGKGGPLLKVETDRPAHSLRDNSRHRM